METKSERHLPVWEIMEPLGRLPGDIHWEGTHGSFHFPVVSCIVVSIILSLIVHFFHK